MSKLNNKDLVQDKSLPKLTRKQKAFVDLLIANPKMSATKAVLQTYNVSNNHSAEVVASENLSKPVIMQHLHDNASRAEQTIVNLLESKKEEVKLASAKDILDRVHGKATQKIEQQTTGVALTIDLTSALSDKTD